MKYIIRTLAFIFSINQLESSTVFPMHSEFTYLIYKREMILNSKVVSKIFHVLTSFDIFILEYPIIVYTAIQCTYAEVLVDLFQTFYEIISHGVESSKSIKYQESKPIEWLEYVHDKIVRIKQSIAQIIFMLFFYLDSIEVLRTTENSFLKSLLGTNLFLNYFKN